MIEKLTKDQEAKLETYKEKWKDWPRYLAHREAKSKKDYRRDIQGFRTQTAQEDYVG